MPKRYNLVALGGTFDHFHDGHQSFIEFAANLGRLLYIGVTHPKLSAHKPYSYLIEPAESRVRSVKKWCRHIGVNCKLTELHNLYGPTLDDPAIEAIVVTEETIDGAKKINETRLKLGLRELPVHVAPLLKNEVGLPLHSEHIRAGQSDRHGTIYSLLFDQDFVLTEEQRQFFRKPLGKLVETPTIHTPSTICVVGDASLEQFISNSWKFDLGIFDGKEQRQVRNSPVIKQVTIDAHASNQAGMISTDLIKTLKKLMHEQMPPQTVLKINGEEDLATVALVLLLPLESVIYYGQPNEGLVEVQVTETLKNKVYQLLRP